MLSFKKLTDKLFRKSGYRPMRDLLDTEKCFKCDSCDRFKYLTELSAKYRGEYVCKACERLRDVKTLGEKE